MKVLFRQCRCIPRFLITFALLGAAIPASAQSFRGGCPNVKAIGNFLPSNDGLQASFTIDSTGTLATYIFTSNNESGEAGASQGVPGLIEYCIYPSAPPGLPDSESASVSGANSDAWGAGGQSAEGVFFFKRPDGDPSNVAFDGSTQTIGTATWCQPVSGVCTIHAPTVQTILLHINDPDECQALYGGTSNTCFVFPGEGSTPPPPACEGNPACKTAQIFDSNGNEFTTPGNCSSVTTEPCVQVPLDTELFINYTYEIINQPANPSGLTMTFKFPPAKTDINNGGGKDYFGCEQLPDESGFPGAWGLFTITDPESNVWNFNLTQSSGACNQSRFTLLPNKQTIIYALGNFITFAVDMRTRLNTHAQKFEYTSPGPHLLNSGFTVKWFQSIPDASGNCVGGQQVWPGPNSLCSFSTSIKPIYVDAE
jgi:hypothetical protein